MFDPQDISPPAPDTSAPSAPQLTFEDTPGTPLTLQDNAAPPSPTAPVAKARAQRINYALGDKSPGQQELENTLSSGQETGLRQAIAGTKSADDNAAKNQYVQSVIQNDGHNLTPEGAVLLNQFHQTPIVHDPDTILEKAFADKYTQDILGMSPDRYKQDADVQQHAEAVGTALSEMQLRKQWLTTQKENTDSEYANQGWGHWLINQGAYMLPGVAWYQQAKLLDRPSHLNWLPGQTIRENIGYLYSLPFEQMQTEYKKAMSALKANGDLVGAQQFADGMVSYSTSDEYISDALGLADYATVGAPIVKGITKFVVKKAADVAVKGAEKGLATDVATDARPIPTEYSKDASPLTTRTPPTEQQLDLFGEQPPQGQFRFMSENQPPWQSMTPPEGPVGPTGLYRKPNGQMAKPATEFDVFGSGDNQYELPSKGTPVNPNTGVFRGPGGRFDVSTRDRFKTQGELPLDEPVHQGNLPLEINPRPSGGQGELFGTAPERPIEPPTVTETKKALGDAHKATEGVDVPSPILKADATGDISNGGFMAAARRLLNPLGFGNDEVLRNIPSTMNPKGFLADSTVISESRADQLVPFLQNQFDKLTATMGKLARVQRLTGDQLTVAKQLAEQSLLKEYGNSLNSAILDEKFHFVPGDQHAANVGTKILQVGKPGGVLFDTKEEAALWARDRYKLPEAVPMQRGYKWYLGIAKHLDETAPEVVEAGRTAENAANKGFISSLLGRLRTANDLLGSFQNEQRQIAVHGQQPIKAFLKEEIDKNIMSLKKDQRAALENMLTLNRDLPNPRNPSQRGFWYQTAGEYEQAFLNRNGRLPTEKEIVAYHTYRRLQDWELLTENAALYRDKARMGAEQHRIAIGDGKFSDWFEGVRRDAMPWKEGKQEHDAGIYVHDATTGKGKFYYQYDQKTPRKEIDDLIENRGYRVIQVFDPKSHPMDGIAKTATGADLKERVNYIITNAAEKKPLSWQQVEYREGPHSVYKNDWYVSQPQIQMGRTGKATYLGDNNILSMETEAQARKWAAGVERGRVLLKTQRLDELAEHLKTLPVEWNTVDKFKQMFVRSDSPLNLDHPIMWKQSGKNTIDSGLKENYGYSNLVNGLHDPHDLTNSLDKAFLLNRDNIINTVKEGAVNHIAPAEQLDPFVALNRALNQRVRNTWMNDYKITAVQNWINEFRHVLDPKLSVLEAFPLKFLYDPQYLKANDILASDVRAAEAARQAIVNFIGTKTELGSTMESVKAKLANSVYNTVGQGRILDATLATTKDPVHFLRGIAFHENLGMFNPVQFWVQAQTMFHSIAVAGPSAGFRGFTAAPLVRALGHNPDMLDAVSNVASKLGWKKNDFKEMWEAMDRSGLYQVAGDAVLRDDAFDPKLFRGTFGHILDSGAMFFNEGERMTRITGFATSYHEWKMANPNAVLDNAALGKIMRRADDLTLNMSRASAASWQSGLWSVPTQFFAYNARVMEQMLGGRLTGTEKLRMMATYSLLYGVPFGVGTTIGGVWPAYDSIKEGAFQRGINLDDGWTKPFTEGLMMYGYHMLTGKDYNTAQRYGPGNQQAFREILHGDKPLNDILLGASGSALSNLLTSTAPLAHWAAATVTGGDYPLTGGDWMGMLQNMKSADLAVRAAGILAYGKWYSKNGQEVSNSVDSMDAAMSLMGLTPMHITNTQYLRNANRMNKQASDEIVKQAEQDFRRSMQAAANGDWSSWQMYRSRAQATMQAADLSFQDQQAAFNRMLKSNSDLEEKTRWDTIKHAPPSRAMETFKTFSQPMK